MAREEDHQSTFWPTEATVGEVVYSPGSTFGPRVQRNLQLVLVHSGCVTVWIDEVAYCAEQDAIFVLFPGHKEYFAFAQGEQTHHSWVHAYLPDFSRELQTRLKLLPWPLHLSAHMKQLMQEALKIQHTPFPTRDELVKALVVQMLWRYIGEGEQQTVRARQVLHPPVEKALEYIWQHLEEPITLDNLASYVAVSPPHLIRLFQTDLQTTPMNYLWQCRVAKGIELLEQTGLTVGTIAMQCGFQSRYHFSRKIRQSTGATPLEIRQRAWRRV